MAEYISTFITGFSDVVRKQLLVDLPNAQVISVFDGLIYYQFDGDLRWIKQIEYFNNTFFVLTFFRSRSLSFSQMVNNTCKGRSNFLINKGTYRIRFSRENKFEKVDAKIVAAAEHHVFSCSNLRIDRVNPTTEIWFIIRTEGVGFYCQLVSKRSTTEKHLELGELRPEFAGLMCGLAHITTQSVLCDPFCGYGAIPKQLVKYYRPKMILVSDIDGHKIQNLKRNDVFHRNNVSMNIADAFCLVHIRDHSVDAIITDPPWGFYEHIDNIEEFYTLMLQEFRRVLKQAGEIIVLSARKDEFTAAAASTNMIIKRKIDTLVNGKKASVFCVVL